MYLSVRPFVSQTVYPFEAVHAEQRIRLVQHPGNDNADRSRGFSYRNKKEAEEHVSEFSPEG